MTHSNAQENQYKDHWETVYQNKTPEQMSWTEETPTQSLERITACGLPKTAAIIDIGGGDSKLVDSLLELGYSNITVLDISQKALQRAQERLGEKAAKVTWIVSDIASFEPTQQYDIWHDRAAFHFLTTPEDVQHYVRIASSNIQHNFIIGTFADTGPDKCSSLTVTKYSAERLSELFSEKFELVNSSLETHTTPFDSKQDFVFCSFKKRS